MKKSVVLLFSIVLFHQHLTAQVLKNAGFETGTTSGWTFISPAYYGFAKDPGYKASIVKDASRKEGYVAKLTSTGKSQWGQLRQRVAYTPIDSFERVRVSGYVKVEGVANGSAGISIWESVGEVMFGASDSSLHGTKGWTKIWADCIVLKQIDSLTVACSIKGPGEVLFDDLRLEKLPAPKMSQSAAAKAYLDTALQIISDYALYKDSVDFGALVAMAHMLAADAKKPADCYKTIQFVLSGLKDRHSFFMEPGDGMEDDNAAIPYAEGRLINGNVGYITVPGFASESPVRIHKYTDSMQRIIRSLDSKDIIGWIVDVRNNRGGTPYPMFLGIGPILGEGVFIRSNEKWRWEDSASYEKGAIHSFMNGRDSVLLQATSPYTLHHAYPKVAVLTNGRTGSAGEMVALSFKHRPNTKQFGTSTYGITTLPHSMPLSDSAYIVVFAAKQTDRLGNPYGGKVYPDVPVSDDGGPTDKVIEAAIRWLKENQ